MAEARREALQERCSGLEREVTDLRGELRETRQQLKEAEQGVELQRGGDRTAELSSLRQLVNFSHQSVCTAVPAVTIIKWLGVLWHFDD